ncbi:MAG: VWA domain-containing protein [Actinobacteria bacterium]|nr:VWA domain-containing protein [Actinomycetota bacterium]
MPVLDLMSGFIAELRSAGLPVSLTENLDAMEAVKEIPIEDRDAFKYALGATLVKSNAHWRAFETIFEVYFSLRGPEYDITDATSDADAEMWREQQEQRQGDGKGQSGGSMDSLTPEEIAQMLMSALMNGDQAMMRALARQAVQRFAGMEPGAKTLRKPLPEDVDFMHASRDEMQNLKKALQPLTRKLAARLARKRRHGRRGPLDFRNTVRHSLSYGGVPADPKFKYPRPAKPELMVVADISGSVAAFARFTLMLVYAIQGQFSKVRSFVFIDGIDEVTSYFKATEDISEAIHRVNTEADVVWVDGHSDYGHAFEVFWERYGKDINAKTTILLLGDARNNYHATQSWVVKEMQKRGRHVYWLNPEPKSYWNTGDSVVGEYGSFTDGVYECRNLRQLEGFVEKLA